MRAVIVVPIYYARNVPLVLRVANDVGGLGVELLAVCNSEAAQEAAQAAGLKVVSSSENMGYGGSANFVARDRAFDWVVLCNDDLEIPGSDLAAFLRLVESLDPVDPWTIGLLEKDHRPFHRIPGVLGVMSNVSLLRAVRDRRGPRKDDACALNLVLTEVPPGTAFPFIFVAISSSTWHSVGGFDPAFPLYFEDTDFLARALRVDRQKFGVVRVRMKHHHSTSTREDLRTSVPVFAWSAYIYLVRHTSLGPRTARLAVAVALIARLVLAVMAKGSVKEHMLGTARAFGTMLSGRKPSLPPWSSRLDVRNR